MEDFIYILIGIAWIAYSVYNQGQKRKRKQQAKSELNPEEELPEVEQDLRSFLDKKLNLDNLLDFEEKPNEYLDSPYSEIDVVEEKDTSSYFKPENEGVSAFKIKHEKTVEHVNAQIIESEEGKFSDDLSEGFLSGEEEFDLKKAIIYSEILNPPYINR